MGRIKQLPGPGRQLLTLRQAAQVVGVSESTLVRWERGGKGR